MMILATSKTSMSLARRVASSSLAVTIAAAAFACGKKQQTAQKPAVPVTIATVRRAAVPIDVSANGTVSPMQTASVSSQVDGIIIDVAFREGQDVDKGQTLFQIDPQPYRAAYNQARANLARDRASAVYAAAEVVRYDSLVLKDYVTKEQADQERATAASAQATVAADSALVASAKFNFDNTTIRAPISGRTGSLLVRTGNLVHGAAGTTLVVINQIHPILVQFAVPATTLSDIQKYSAKSPLPVTVYQAAVQNTGAAAPAPASADSTGSDQPQGTAVGPPSAARSRRPGRPATAAGGPPGGPPSVHHGAGTTSGAAGTTSGAAGSPPPDQAAGATATQGADQTDASGINAGGLSGGPPGGGVTGAGESTLVPIGPAIDGTLSFVNNAVDTTTGTVLLKGTFANAGGELWPGEYVATVLRLYVQQNALVLPPQAVMTGQQGTYVFVVDTGNTVRQRSVTVSRATDSLAVISSGVAEGEHVVTDGQSRLQNGAKVSVKGAGSGANSSASAARSQPSSAARPAG